MKPFLPVPNPVAFTIFGLDIMWYAVMITIGAVLGGILLCRRTVTRGFSTDDALDMIIYCTPPAIICSRLYYVIFEWQYFSKNPKQILNIRGGGLAIHGAIIAILVVVALLSRRKKQHFFDWMDLGFPGIVLAQSIGRWGNYFNSEAHGTPTDLPWHILCDGELVHPTFLYESIWCLLLCIFLVWLDSRHLKKGKGFKGQITCLYLMLYSLERFFVEGLRTDSLYLDPARTIRQAQVISVGIIIGAAVLYFILKKKAMPITNEPEYDLVIKNGLIADGSGNEIKKGAVYVTGDRIARIDSNEGLGAKESVDAKGQMVCPGFIDMHTHSDQCPWKAPGFESRLHQGVTTDISGNCGFSQFPKKEPEDGIGCLTMSELKEELKTIAMGANYGTLIGHGALRDYCLSDPYAPVPPAEEIDAMKQTLRREMENGALGMSVGLEYMPGMCCETEELIELAKVIAEFDGIVSVHMRNEDDTVFNALEEVHRIARESGAHLHISHLKVSNKPQWGRAADALAAIDAMKADSRVTVDQYPFTASCTGLDLLLPAWAKKGSSDEITAFLADDENWNKLRDIIDKQMDRIGGPDRVVVSDSNNGLWPEIEGKSMAEIALMEGIEPADAYRMVMLRCKSAADGIYHAMDREDVLNFLRREDLAVISDSTSQDFVTGEVEGKPHPRTTCSQAKFLRLVREENLMPIEKAVAKMSSVPAKLLGLKDRGLIKEGYFADLVIFNPETVSEGGDYGDPFHIATGFDKVYVNGSLAWEGGRPAGRAGRLVEKKKA